MDKIDIAIEVRIMDNFKDNEKKERKKLNITVYGVFKSDKSEPGDRKVDDTQMVKKIFGELGVEAEIKNVIRLGREVENKNRLTKVVLKDYDKSLNCAKKLRNNKAFSRIFILPDMTRRKRDGQKTDREVKE